MHIRIISRRSLFQVETLYRVHMIYIYERCSMHRLDLKLLRNRDNPYMHIFQTGTWNIEKISRRGCGRLFRFFWSKGCLSRSKRKKFCQANLKNLRITITNDHLDAYSYYLKKETGIKCIMYYCSQWIVHRHVPWHTEVASNVNFLRHVISVYVQYVVSVESYAFIRLDCGL